MNNKDMNSIFEKINNLKKPATEVEEKTIDIAGDALKVNEATPMKKHGGSKTSIN